MQCFVLHPSCHGSRVGSLLSSANRRCSTLRCAFACLVAVMLVRGSIMWKGNLCLSVIRSVGEGRLCLGET
jgi:hypothetical protein